MAAAALQLSSGSIISADATSVISALTDYEASGDTSYANLLLGTPFSCSVVLYRSGMFFQHSFDRCRRGERKQLAGGNLWLDDLPADQNA
jgi:hypothetical protein